MAWQLLNIAVEVTHLDKELDIPVPNGAKSILLCLASHADQQGVCFPSYRTFRKWGTATWTRTTIKRNLKMLVDHGLLEVSPRRDRSGRNTSSLYRLNVPRLRELAEVCGAGGEEDMEGEFGE